MLHFGHGKMHFIQHFCKKIGGKFEMSNKDLEGTFKLKPYRDKSQEKKVIPSWSSPFYSMLIM